MPTPTPSAPDLAAARTATSQPAVTSSSSSAPNSNNNANTTKNIQSDDRPPSITTTLAQLNHEKKNQNLPRLPPSHTILRRPIIHAPIASPFAGPTAQKVVYVSSKTPVMSAVKRVRKFLQQIEKRAIQDVKLIERGEREGMRRLADAKERLAKEKEEVVVKASGRARVKAIAVGRWFEEKETEWKVSVEVRGGSVSVVDDVVEAEGEERAEGDDSGGDEQDGEDDMGDVEVAQEETVLDEGETTIELLGAVEGNKSTVNTTEGGKDIARVNEAEHRGNPKSETEAVEENSGPASGKTAKRRRRKKKRKTYDEDDVPEQRLRWIRTVEVAISLKA